MKVCQNYFKEKTDADQCHLAEKPLKFLPLLYSSVVKSFGGCFRYYVTLIVGLYQTTDFLSIFSHILNIS